MRSVRQIVCRAAAVPLHRGVVPLGLALIMTTGCAYLGGRQNDDGRGGIGWKMVMEKLPPSYLIAVDRSECTVTAKRYSEVEVGEQAFCAWGTPGVAQGPWSDQTRIDASALSGSHRRSGRILDAARPRPPHN
ncbi:MAG: hypothetical protein ACREKM_07280 [Longimicrobiales bacterium]